MQITTIQLKNFRCFSNKILHLEAPIVLLEGSNGSGKTSVLEALHYLCYMRSFRTYIPKDLIMFGEDEFFVKIQFQANSDMPILHELCGGFSNKKRMVKVDQKIIISYKELIEYYRVVTLTENDLDLIQGAPEGRRAFMDQAIMLTDASYLQLLKKYKQVLDNRNALLRAQSGSHESYELWTEQLWQLSCAIAAKRKDFLALTHEIISELLNTYFVDQDVTIDLLYSHKAGFLRDSYQEFQKERPDLYQQERRFGRSLFGAHLDDFIIKFMEKRSRAFASRGQQKLVILLIKIAHMLQLRRQKGEAIFLLDDFMTDFDYARLELLLPALSDLQTQLIFTSPLYQSPLWQRLSELGAQTIKLTD